MEKIVRSLLIKIETVTKISLSIRIKHQKRNKRLARK